MTLKSLSHPNILKAYGFYQKKMEDLETYIMVIEHVDSGPIINQLENLKGVVSEDDISKLVTRLLSMLDYCHA